MELSEIYTTPQVSPVSDLWIKDLTLLLANQPSKIRTR
jgi:hypothetical protein